MMFSFAGALTAAALCGCGAEGAFFPFAVALAAAALCGCGAEGAAASRCGNGADAVPTSPRLDGGAISCPEAPLPSSERVWTVTLFRMSKVL